MYQRSVTSVTRSQIVLLALGSLTFVGACSTQKTATFGEITVGRLNVVSADGRQWIVLSNPERFPNPVIDGKEYPRSIAPAGIVFYDGKGSETGGLAIVSVPGVGEQAMLVLDYANSEAIGFGKFETEDNQSYQAGIEILDRVPLRANIEEVGSVGTSRISITNENRSAEVVLKDTRGRPRIRIYVDEKDEPRIEVLDANGAVLHSWP
jgi:hypothetical protein